MERPGAELFERDLVTRMPDVCSRHYTRLSLSKHNGDSGDIHEPTKIFANFTMSTLLRSIGRA